MIQTAYVKDAGVISSKNDILIIVLIIRAINTLESGT